MILWRSDGYQGKHSNNLVNRERFMCTEMFQDDDIPSLSISGSQASPSPSLSVSVWSALAILGQLSQASPEGSGTSSVFAWSGLIT